MAECASPVDCLAVAVRGSPQVVYGDEEDGEADEGAGRQDGAEDDLDLRSGEGRQRGQGQVLGGRHRWYRVLLKLNGGSTGFASSSAVGLWQEFRLVYRAPGKGLYVVA